MYHTDPEWSRHLLKNECFRKKLVKAMGKPLEHRQEESMSLKNYQLTQHQVSSTIPTKCDEVLVPAPQMVMR